MNQLAARRMALRLTTPFAAGADTIEFMLGDTPGHPEEATIAAYSFADYVALFDRPPAPRYVLLALRDVPQTTIVTANYAILGPANPLTGARQQLRTGSGTVPISAGTPAGASFALALGSDDGPDTQLTSLTMSPPPADGSAAQYWSVTALLGNLAKLLWVIGGERDLIRAQMARIAAQRRLAAATRYSLDLLGADLGVPRFPPLPYTFDDDAIALYHLDDQAPPSQEVDQVVDALAQFGKTDHPGQNVGRLASSGAPGRFGRGFAFRSAGAVLRIADHTDFALPAASSFTVECFLKPDAGSPDGHALAKHANPAVATAAGWALSVGDFGRGVTRNVRFLLGDGAAQLVLFADRSLPTDRYSHVAGVIDRGAGVATLYVDGVLQSTQPLTDLGALTNSEPINLGLTANAPYTGLLDEVRLSAIARSTFNPVVGEGDDDYRRRLGIFQRWTVPTPAALVDQLNQAVGDIGGDPAPLIVNDVDSTLVGASLGVRVVPTRLLPGECIDSDGNRNRSEAQVSGEPADEVTFDPAFLVTHNDARVDYAPAPPRVLAAGELPPNTHQMQLVTERALNQLLGFLPNGGRLRIVSAFDPEAGDLRQVGRGLLLTHSTLDLGQLAALVHVAGFSYACYRVDLGVVSASMAPGEYLEIQTAGGTATPGNGFDLLTGQSLQLSTRPALPVGSAYEWLTIACGQGRGQFTGATGGAAATLQATAAGSLMVRVGARWPGHLATGALSLRVGIGSLADGASIGADGTLGVTPAVAAQPDAFFDPSYVVTLQDARASYGTALNNRRVQPGVSYLFGRLLDLVAGTHAAGQMEVDAAWTPGSSDLHAVGRALTLRHAALGAGLLGALAFAAGFSYVRRQGDQIEAQLAPMDLVTITGAQQVAEGANLALSMQPVAAPAAVALGPTVAYVANPGTDTVSVLDRGSGSVQRAIKVGWQPSALALSPDGLRLYSADTAGNTVTAIDTATGAVSGTVAVAGGPVALAHHPTQNRLYAACAAGGTVVAIDTAALTVSATVAAGNHPTGLAVTPNGNEVWVALDTDRRVAVLTTAPFQPAASIALPGVPAGLSLGPGGANGYVTLPATGQLIILNVAARSAGAAIAVGAGTTPRAVATGPDSTVYVAATGSEGGRVYAFHADGSAAGSAGVGNQPAGLAATANAVVVANSGDNTVSLLSPSLLVAPGPDAPALLATWLLGSGRGERLSWAMHTSAAARAQLGSTAVATTTLRGVRAGPVLVRAVYALRDNPDPYTFEVRLKPALEQANAVMRKNQYDLAMNVLNALHPVGVEVITRRLRQYVVELRNQELDPFPPYTYPDYRGRAYVPQRQSGG